MSFRTRVRFPPPPPFFSSEETRPPNDCGELPRVRMQWVAAAGLIPRAAHSVDLRRSARLCPSRTSEAFCPCPCSRVAATARFPRAHRLRHRLLRRPADRRADRARTPLVRGGGVLRRGGPRSRVSARHRAGVDLRCELRPHRGDRTRSAGARTEGRTSAGDARWHRAPRRRAGPGLVLHLARPRSLSDAGGASIAVLPFANLSSDKEQEYFSDGLAG